MISIPRPASTVILVDQSYRIYLTKRPDEMKFLGGHFVFPGGQVDKEDNQIPEEYYQIAKQIEAFDISFRIAAARELFEEVGILLTKSQEPLHFKYQSITEYRKLLIERKISFHELLKKESIILDLEALHYFGHFITPETQPIRFDTRFFIATLPEGQSPVPDKHEIEEAFWIHSEDALSDYEAGKIQMVPPTIISLKTIRKYVKGEGPLQISGKVEKLQ